MRIFTGVAKYQLLYLLHKMKIIDISFQSPACWYLSSFLDLLKSRLKMYQTNINL